MTRRLRHLPIKLVRLEPDRHSSPFDQLIDSVAILVGKAWSIEFRTPTGTRSFWRPRHFLVPYGRSAVCGPLVLFHALDLRGMREEAQDFYG